MVGAHIVLVGVDGFWDGVGRNSGYWRLCFGETRASNVLKYHNAQLALNVQQYICAMNVQLWTAN